MIHRLLCSLFFLAGVTSATPGLAQPATRQQNADTSSATIFAGTLLDGRGRTFHNVVITVSGGKIQRVDPLRPGITRVRTTYELSSATLMPGIIDAHVHPGWYINSKGALHGARDGDTPTQSALARAGNLYATLAAGVTTIQSVGGPEDLDLREAVARGALPGPRILTSIRQLNDTSLTPDSLRARSARLSRREPISSSCSPRLAWLQAVLRPLATRNSARSVARRSR